MHIIKFFIVALLIVFSINAKSISSKIPTHPNQLKYRALDWEIPLGEPFKVTLKNGQTAYIAENPSLPLVEISGHIKYGTVLDPKGKEGLGELYSSLLRNGGTKAFSPDSLDQLLAQCAIQIHFMMLPTELKFSVSYLSEFEDTALKLLNQIVINPSFDSRRFERESKIYKESIKHQFDNPSPTLSVAYQKVLYPGQTISRIPTLASIDAITRKDLIDLHKKVFSQKRVILAAAGKFEKNKIIAALEALFPGNADSTDQINFPSIQSKPSERFLIVDKKISQAYIQLGTPLFQRPHPDYYAISLVNMIFGGGGFTSRLGTRIRSDEGLTYSIYSNTESNYFFPGTFFINFFTKTESMPRALELTLEEIAILQEKGISKSELHNARSSLIDELPSMFRSSFDIVSTYAWNDYFGRSPDHFKDYPTKLKALSTENLQEAAKKYFNTDSLSLVIVGDAIKIQNLLKTNPALIKKFGEPKIISPEAIVNLP